MLRKTGEVLLARQKIERPVSNGKIPIKRQVVSKGIDRNGVVHTLWNNFPDEHNAEYRPEKPDTLRGHLVVVMQCLEQVCR